MVVVEPGSGPVTSSPRIGTNAPTLLAAGQRAPPSRHARAPTNKARRARTSTGPSQLAGLWLGQEFGLRQRRLQATICTLNLFAPISFILAHERARPPPERGPGLCVVSPPSGNCRVERRLCPLRRCCCCAPPACRMKRARVDTLARRRRPKLAQAKAIMAFSCKQAAAHVCKPHFWAPPDVWPRESGQIASANSSPPPPRWLTGKQTKHIYLAGCRLCQATHNNNNN